MDLLNTSRFRVDLLTKVCVLMFVCRVNTAQSSKMAVACFGVNGCNTLTLSCNDQQIIRLVDQQYNYVQNGQHCNTMGRNTYDNCHKDSPGSCCVIKNENCMAPVSELQTFELFEKCSRKQLCVTQARIGTIQGCTTGNNTLDDSNFLTYDCDNENDTVQLCSNMSRTSNSINVIFNGRSTMTSYTTSQTCSCSISSNSRYHAYLHDFRSFRPGNTYECSSLSLNGNGKMCNGLKLADFIYQSQTKLNITNHTITARDLFSQGRDDRPSMVWIRIKTDESDPNPKPLTVTCTGATPGDTDTSTISVTASLPTSSTSTTVKTSMTTYPSSTSPTSLPNGGTTHAATSDTSDGTGVPSAAIVVPIVLVLLGLAAGVGIWYWRKRRKAITEKNTNISNEQQNVTAGRISSTDNTYNLPEEGEYSTIDGNGLATSSFELDNYGYIVPAVTMRADDTPEYEVPVHVDGDGGEEHAYSILDKVDQQ